jgi:hypothetical protein
MEGGNEGYPQGSKEGCGGQTELLKNVYKALSSSRMADCTGLVDVELLEAVDR